MSDLLAIGTLNPKKRAAAAKPVLGIPSPPTRKPEQVRVLITGAAGLIGRRLTRYLEGVHELKLGDLQPMDDEPRWIRLDVTDAAQVRDAVEGVDAVVHLAIASGHEGDYEDEEFNRRRFDVNVHGTWNVLNAAAQAGVKRFVHTSSLTVVWGYPPPENVAGDAPARPVGTYAVTKHLAEVMCEHAAREFGLSTICLRIAKPIDLDDPSWKSQPLRPQWIAFPDLLQAYSLALAAHDIDFEIVTLVGESNRRRWDLLKAEQLLGYYPKYRLEELGYRLGNESEALIAGDPGQP